MRPKKIDYDKVSTSGNSKFSRKMKEAVLFGKSKLKI